MSGMDVLRFAIPFWGAVFIADYLRYHCRLACSHHDRIVYSVVPFFVSFFAFYALENYVIALLCRQEAKERKQENEKPEPDLP